MAATPARQFRVADALWNAAKDAAARRNTTRTAYLIEKLTELVEADRIQQAWTEGLEAPAPAAGLAAEEPLEGLAPHSTDDADGDHVRRTYGVPAHIDDRIVLDGRPGVIVGFDTAAAYLVVRFDDSPALRRAHPTWRVDYTAAAWATQESTA